MIAEIYIDIPAGSVDKPFDYQIPDELVHLVCPGIRVTVPFGRTRRLGFVTAVKASSELKKLRKVSQVIDPVPVLTPELLGLGNWLAETTLCPTVSAYQAMLPAVMKASYEKQVTVADRTRLDREFPELIPLFSKDFIGWRRLLTLPDPQKLDRIRRAINDGVLSVRQNVQNQARIRKRTVISASVSKERLEAFLQKTESRSERQRDVLRFFISRNEPDQKYPVSELVTKQGLSRQALHALTAKGLFTEEKKEQFRNPYEALDEEERTQPLPLTDEQEKAIRPIIRSVDRQETNVFLCHGVTGSGKTELYLQSIQRVIDKGRQAIVLVPEISLTPLMVHRFKGRFGNQVAVMHSGLSRGEKYDEWRRIREGRVSVAVGARSAVFAPFENLGLIIIDEEHESSYKQEDIPRYHARDVAIHRAARNHCPVVLGSATPSLESYARARKKVYQLLTLKERFNHHPLPPVDIVDMREEMRDGNHSVFSKELFTKLQERVARHEQTVLFLNRRGYATFVMCRSCGTVIKCPHCDISLTYHRASHLLKCHYCGYETRVPDACPSCGSDAMRYFGTGTQKVEAELNRLMPEARVIRMDVDTTGRKGGHEKLLRRFGEHQADILLGTQMIAKGLDFPEVTLVGVLAADSMLYLPDFRASEKTFQLLTQVSGRAGRHDLPGEVVIQSYSPDHYAVTDAAANDFNRFYQEEMQIRHRLGYPPFYYLTLITVTHPEAAQAAGASERIASILRNSLSSSVRVLGPAVPSVARIKDRYRFQCMVKYKREPKLLPVLHQIMQHFKETGKNGLQLSIDMNPVSLM
ncbi:primosomal protein N' [Sporolactobacillus vineae]|uniref:primosomal protein N' n=1 Tax=Sporolactobacillus vineae TaxID=444463 RepID=UPI0002881119|nr:primosomal protein N' [Sporolactobacillus vineae]